MVRVLSRIDGRLCLQQHVIYNSVTRSKSREKEMEKKDTDGMQGRSKEKKEEKDRKDRKRVSVWDYQPSSPPFSCWFNEAPPLRAAAQQF